MKLSPLIFISGLFWLSSSIFFSPPLRTLSGHTHTRNGPNAHYEEGREWRSLSRESLPTDALPTQQAALSPSGCLQGIAGQHLGRKWEAEADRPHPKRGGHEAAGEGLGDSLQLLDHDGGSDPASAHGHTCVEGWRGGRHSSRLSGAGGEEPDDQVVGCEQPRRSTLKVGGGSVGEEVEAGGACGLFPVVYVPARTGVPSVHLWSWTLGSRGAFVFPRFCHLSQTRDEVIIKKHPHGAQVVPCLAPHCGG